MTRPNVRLEGTGVIHAHARSKRNILRCGTRFVRVEQERGPSDTRRRGFDTEDPVDCMTCLTKDEWSNADVGEIVREAVKSVRYASAFEWESRK